MAPQGATCVHALWGDFRGTPGTALPAPLLRPHAMPTSSRHQLTWSVEAAQDTWVSALLLAPVGAMGRARPPARVSDTGNTAFLEPPARD